MDDRRIRCYLKTPILQYSGNVSPGRGLEGAVTTPSVEHKIGDRVVCTYSLDADPLPNVLDNHPIAVILEVIQRLSEL
jgi:hypothetical protein